VCNILIPVSHQLSICLCVTLSSACGSTKTAKLVLSTGLPDAVDSGFGEAKTACRPADVGLLSDACNLQVYAPTAKEEAPAEHPTAFTRHNSLRQSQLACEYNLAAPLASFVETQTMYEGQLNTES
jgi:hypothetical protein